MLTNALRTYEEDWGDFPDAGDQKIGARRLVTHLDGNVFNTGAAWNAEPNVGTGFQLTTVYMEYEENDIQQALLADPNLPDIDFIPYVCDPWGHPYYYMPNTASRVPRFYLWSAGPDGRHALVGNIPTATGGADPNNFNADNIISW